MWLLTGKIYIFNMDSNIFIGLKQFHFTVYSIINMVTAFSILLQLHGILLILVLFILDFSYLVVPVVASLKSNLENIPKHSMRFKGKSIPPCRDDPPAHALAGMTHLISPALFRKLERSALICGKNALIVVIYG